MSDMSPRLRWSIYWLLIVAAASLVTARIMRVRSPDAFSPTPFQSANDKSRWCTIRALGDHGVYSIEHLIFYDNGEKVRGWYTIDLVRHRGPDGREHYYSSKPTLLPTLLAGEYWLVKRLTGLSLSVPEQVWPVARLMLVLTNVVPLVIALYLLARLVEHFGQTDWGRLFAFFAAALATFVTTFSVTLNNHSLAACTVIFALAAAIPVWQGRGDWRHLATAGFFFAFTAANELPGLSLCVFAGAALATRFPLKTAVAFVPPAVLVAAAAIGTNYYAHGEWRPPYAHRQDGPVIGLLPDELAVPLNDGQVTGELRTALQSQGIALGEQATIDVQRRGDRWQLFDERTHERYVLQRTPEGVSSQPMGIEISRYNNWYDYPGTHWDPKTIDGLDRGELSVLVYAFHCLVGHHGLFSLTPLWLLSIAGCVWWLLPKPRPVVGVAGGATSSSEVTLTNGQGFATTARILAILTVSVTAIVIAFYLTRPLSDRNYGGGTCCLRWLLWLTPLWILTLLPAADWLGGSRGGRIAAVLLLAISLFSAHYAADNPWAHPWLFTLGEWLGWWSYP
jgi:hypothetical protein